MAEEFARELSRRIVADVAGMCGFHTIRHSASDILCDLLRSYIVNIGHEAVQYSNHAGRTEQNVFDTAHALHFIGGTRMDQLIEYKESIEQGIAQHHKHSGSGSGYARDLEGIGEEINLSLFETEVPAFPVTPLYTEGGMDASMATGDMGRVDRTIMYLMEQDEQEALEAMLAEDERERQQQEQQGDEEDERGRQHDGIDGVRKGVSSTSESKGMDMLERMSAEQRSAERERWRAAKLWELSLPDYLPQLPPKHTYADTPVHTGRMKSSLQLQKMKTRQKRRVQASLTRIYERELELRDQQPQQQSDEMALRRRTRANKRKRRIEEEWYNMYESLSGLTARAEMQDATGATGPDGNGGESAADDMYKFERRQKITNPYLVVMRKAATGSEFEHETDGLVASSPSSSPQSNVHMESAVRSRQLQPPQSNGTAADDGQTLKNLLVRQPRIYKSTELIEKDANEDHVAKEIAAKDFSEKMDFNRKKTEGILSLSESELVTDSAFGAQQ